MRRAHDRGPQAAPATHGDLIGGAVSGDSTHDAAALNAATRDAWDANAAFWDERMGEGNDWHLELVAPAVLRLLAPREGEAVLDLACGNGLFARRLASLGVRVVGCDFAPAMLERARANRGGADRIDYRLLDATDPAQLAGLGESAFDAVVCNMALMDIADIGPLAAALPRLLKTGGRFVFAVTHPFFNGLGSTRMVEEDDVDGEIVRTYSVKVSRYMRPTAGRGLAIEGQPVPQYYFDRPLSLLLSTFFEQGLVLDGLEEPVFESRPDDRVSLGRGPFVELPPVLAARLRVAE